MSTATDINTNSRSRPWKIQNLIVRRACGQNTSETVCRKKAIRFVDVTVLIQLQGDMIGCQRQTETDPTFHRNWARIVDNKEQLRRLIPPWKKASHFP
jgi:hypothetical protein